MLKLTAVLLAVLLGLSAGAALGQGGDSRRSTPRFEGFREELLLKDRLGKNVVVTLGDSSLIKGRLVGVDSLHLQVRCRHDTLALPLDSLLRLEFRKNPGTEGIKILSAVFIAPFALLGCIIIIGMAAE